MFYSFRQTNARFILNLSSRTLECHISLIIYCMTHVHQGHNFHLWSRTYKLTLSSPEHAPAYMMAPNAGVIKAIVSFYRINSDTAINMCDMKPYITFFLVLKPVSNHQLSVCIHVHEGCCTYHWFHKCKEDCNNMAYHSISLTSF